MRRLLDLPPDLEERHFWKSDREVCFFRHLALTEDPDDPGQWELAGFDAESGTSINFEGFNSQHSSRMVGAVGHAHFEGEPGHEVFYIRPTFAVHSGAQRLAWLRNFPLDQQEWTTTCLNGSEVHHWPHPVDPESGQALSGLPVWLRDGRRLAVFRKRYHRGYYTLPEARLYDCDAPDGFRSVNFTGAADGILTGVDQHDHVLLRNHEPGPSSEVRFQRLRLDTPEAAAGHFRVELPHPAQVEGVVASPSGDRIAWILGEESQQEEIYGLWVSRSDGKQMERLAVLPDITQPSPGDQSDSRYEWPRELTWRPGGQRLVFVYCSALWEVEIG